MFPDDFDAPLIFGLVASIDPDPRVKALVARVDQCRDRHAAFENRLILVALRDAIPGFVAIEFDQRMTERGYVFVLRPALGHRIDSEE